MKKVILWGLFVVFLILIISPIDLSPGPLDDIVYGILDIVIVAVLQGLRAKKKALPPPGGSGSAGTEAPK